MERMPAARAGAAGGGLWIVLGLLAAEFAAISLIYKHGIDFDCQANWGWRICGAASGVMVSALTLAGALALFAMLARGAMARFLPRPGRAPCPSASNLAGVAVMFLPLLFLENGTGRMFVAPAAAVWGLGMLLGGAGAALMLAPPARWRTLLAEAGRPLALSAVAGLAAPYLAIKIRPLWQVDTITRPPSPRWSGGRGSWATASRPTLRARSSAPRGSGSTSPRSARGRGDGPGHDLRDVFLILFRHELRFPLALVLLPLGIAVSALLNVVRIVALLALGLSGHPELAVGGFHSHAGWLMFTLIALGVVALARGVPALYRGRRARGRPRRRPCPRCGAIRWPPGSCPSRC
ncbi:archaeosortase/exosortase family protein [Rhodovulum sp. ES.010]|uniref:archaeosortase/exosortase family protein n=1 Tax=Rhodovulum sp. ES.010 TaxID=1882821 RepID=UPI000940BF0A|nr:archaeosortase/exosortase family protein [Rhodovulum sp. ES.010]